MATKPFIGNDFAWQRVMGMFDFKGIVRHLRAIAVYRTGLFSLRMRQRARGHSLTLMYHRVISGEAGGPFLQPGMYVEPDTFEKHLRFLKKHFQLLPSSTLCLSDSDNAVTLSGRPACVLTFDDGWVDFYTNVFPHLVKHQIPATVFLATGFIGTVRRFWPERLGLICASAVQRGKFLALKNYAKLMFSLPDSAFATAIGFQEELIRCLKSYRLKDIENHLDQLESKFAEDGLGAIRNFLSWEEVAEMHRSGLVTFGSHTENHLLLTTLSSEEINSELVISKQALFNRHVNVGSSLSFCYPNGNYNSYCIASLGHAGYSCAFTTNNGWNTRTTPRFELKRVGVHQDISATESLLAYRIYSAAQ